MDYTAVRLGVGERFPILVTPAALAAPQGQEMGARPWSLEAGFLVSR